MGEQESVLHDILSCRTLADQHVCQAQRAAKRLADAEEDILAYMALLPGHWTRCLPSNPLGRLNRDVKRCPEIVGVLHDQD